MDLKNNDKELKSSHKFSIRFYQDHEVRAVWDEANSKWWFSAIDIIRAINDESDYVKAGNYWRWLKRKLNADGVQLVSVTHEFKFEAPDGKRRAADAPTIRVWKHWQSIIPIIEPTAFWIGSLMATTPLMGKAVRKHIPFLKADCLRPWSREA